MPRRRFDQNNDRVDYGELLSADAYYELDKAVGLTYSLDMEALMGIPLCLGMHGEMTTGQKNNPLYVLEAIRRTGKKLSIFCNAGCIKVPKTESRLYALLEDSIHEVRMPNYKNNFHPKLWILQYHNIHDGSLMIKIVTLSRNLTFDQSMDVAVDMEGFVGSKINPKNQPIADLLTFVSQFDSNKNRYKILIENIRRVESFELLDCFDDYEFHPFGIYGKNENGIKRIPLSEHRKSPREMFRDCYALFVVSPFLSESVIGDLLDDYSKNPESGPVKRCLITRDTSVTRRIYDAFNRRGGDGVWTINPALSSNDALEDGDTFGYVNRDVHAKIFFTDKYNESKKLYLGSLNASNNAFDHNVEFLLELSYKPYHASYESVRDDFLPVDDEKNGCPFVQMTGFDEIEKADEESKVDFREAVYGVKSAEVISCEGSFSIKVYCDHAFDGITIRPFYVKTNIKPLTEEVVFEGISLSNLSNMFILSKDGEDCLIRLEVTGMPSEEREDAIFNDIISNRPMFMTYMRYLLDEDFYDSISFEELSSQSMDAGDNPEGYGFAVEPDIYERMLKAAAEYPERFDSMYEVVEKIDDDKIGEEFKQLLELFIRAAGGKGKGRK
ncbi:hypothetical protein SAMN05216391_102153 [Lachnospiraceae bacterium KHCPX20]|nr:hypothetical protein SAMN05216391_102153 [Lachnospiraceae bacterium KHCPX20]